MAAYARGLHHGSSMSQKGVPRGCFGLQLGGSWGRFAPEGGGISPRDPMVQPCGARHSMLSTYRDNLEELLPCPSMGMLPCPEATQT